MSESKFVPSKLVFVFVTGIFIAMMAFVFGMAGSAQAATTDSNQWVRVLRNYTDYVEVGDYYYYFTHPDQGGKYKIYREHKETGKVTKLQTVKNPEGNDVSVFTNGKRLLWTYQKNGTMVCSKAIGSSKVKTVVNLKKFKKWNSQDWVLGNYVYGNFYYYSKYHTLGDKTVWKVYRANVKTGKQKAIKSGWTIAETLDFCSGRYLPFVSKSGMVKIFDTKTKKMRKLGKHVFGLTLVDKKWYFDYCTKPYSTAKKAHKIKSKAVTGKGKVKTVASFKSKYTADSIMEITSEHVIFLGGNSDYAKEYIFAKKKFKTRKDMDVWYFVAKYSNSN